MTQNHTYLHTQTDIATFRLNRRRDWFSKNTTGHKIAKYFLHFFSRNTECIVPISGLSEYVGIADLNLWGKYSKTGIYSLESEDIPDLLKLSRKSSIPYGVLIYWETNLSLDITNFLTNCFILMVYYRKHTGSVPYRLITSTRCMTAQYHYFVWFSNVLLSQ